MRTQPKGHQEGLLMYTFDTPGPIVAVVESSLGQIRIRAGDRADTAVVVRPSDESQDADIQAAEQTQVEFESGRLTVKAPRSKIRSLIGRPPSVDVTIDLPTGSHVEGKSGGNFRGEGRLGDTDFEAVAGSVRLEETGRLKVRAAVGEISVGRTVGSVDVVSSSAKVWIGQVDGTATVKSSNGDIVIGAATGDLRLKTANGDLSIGSSRAAINAKTAHGSVRIGEAVNGTAVLETAFGEVEVGVPEGTAAWLEVSSQHGNVRSDLDAAEAPDQTAETVEIHARTRYGDVLIRRA